MQNFRTRREKLRKTNVQFNFSIFDFFDLTSFNLNVGLLISLTQRSSGSNQNFFVLAFCSSFLDQRKHST